LHDLDRLTVLNRKVQFPTDIADLNGDVIFAALVEVDYVTGENVTIDGGLTMRIA